MPGAGTPNERRTLNIERPTSNEKQTSIVEQGAAISVSSAFPIKPSMLEVRCSTFNFSVTIPQSIQRKNNLPPIGCGR
jgi:hypothetical protein